MTASLTILAVEMKMRFGDRTYAIHHAVDVVDLLPGRRMRWGIQFCCGRSVREGRQSIPSVVQVLKCLAEGTQVGVLIVHWAGFQKPQAV